MASNCSQCDLCDIFVFGQLHNSIYFENIFLEHFTWGGCGGMSDMMWKRPEVWPPVNIIQYLCHALTDKSTCKNNKYQVCMDVSHSIWYYVDVIFSQKQNNNFVTRQAFTRFLSWLLLAWGKCCSKLFSNTWWCRVLVCPVIYIGHMINFD